MNRPGTVFTVISCLAIATMSVAIIPTAMAVPPSASLPESPWSQCDHLPPVIDNDRLEPDPKTLSTQLLADSTEAVGRETIKLRGNVVIQRGDELLQSENAVYNQALDRTEVTGGVRYHSSKMSITGHSGEMALGQENGQINQAQFQMYKEHARGSAGTVEFNGPNQIRLIDTRYTTCDPGNNDWYLKSPEINLDREAGFGSAKHMTLSFMHVPLLYLPYMSFPIDDRRRSGVLVPSYANSNTSGSEIEIPIYLNLAPNQDATITPRYMSRRGTQLQGEYRYLSRQSHGNLGVEYLPNDELFKDSRTAVTFHHTAQLGNNWNGNVAYDYVSDQEYFVDLDNNLATSSMTHLEQRFDLSKNSDVGNFSMLLQHYQTLDPAIAVTSRPYQRLPQLRFDTGTRTSAAGGSYRVNMEYTRFDRDDSLNADRYTLEPILSYEKRGLAGFLIPRLGIRHTSYVIDPITPVSDEKPSTTAAIFSLDSGLFFERELNLGKTGLIQTLEPRLYYLYVPKHDQADQPVFDSGVIDFSFAQLFRENRFSGGDRIGDADQVSIGLSSRLLHQQDGRERIRASIGQILYFQDREVVIPGDAVATESSSDIAAELTVQISRGWSSSVYLQQNEANREFYRQTYQFSYRDGNNRLVNLSYRLRENELEQSDFSFAWPVGRRWHAYGRYYFSHLDGYKLESVAGFEYDSCCWNLQIVSRSYVNDSGGQTNDAVLVQLAFKGLARVGDKSEELLEHAIMGYKPKVIP